MLENWYNLSNTAYWPTSHSRPQRPRSFWSALKIATPGKVQHRKSAIRWLADNTKLLLCTCSKSWAFPVVAIPGANQKVRGFWRREWLRICQIVIRNSTWAPISAVSKSDLWRVVRFSTAGQDSGCEIPENFVWVARVAGINSHAGGSMGEGTDSGATNDESC